MYPIVNEKLTTFSANYIYPHELGSFIDRIILQLSPLDDQRKADLIAGLIERVYEIGLSNGVKKSVRKMAQALVHGIEISDHEFKHL